jgi:hypothetical protein
MKSTIPKQINLKKLLIEKPYTAELQAYLLTQWYWTIMQDFNTHNSKEKSQHLFFRADLFTIGIKTGSKNNEEHKKFFAELRKEIEQKLVELYFVWPTLEKELAKTKEKTNKDTTILAWINYLKTSKFQLESRRKIDLEILEKNQHGWVDLNNAIGIKLNCTNPELPEFCIISKIELYLGFKLSEIHLAMANGELNRTTTIKITPTNKNSPLELIHDCIQFIYRNNSQEDTKILPKLLTNNNNNKGQIGRELAKIRTNYLEKNPITQYTHYRNQGTQKLTPGSYTQSILPFTTTINDTTKYEIQKSLVEITIKAANNFNQNNESFKIPKEFYAYHKITTGYEELLEELQLYHLACELQSKKAEYQETLDKLIKKAHNKNYKIVVQLNNQQAHQIKIPQLLYNKLRNKWLTLTLKYSTHTLKNNPTSQISQFPAVILNRKKEFLAVEIESIRSFKFIKI